LPIHRKVRGEREGKRQNLDFERNRESVRRHTHPAFDITGASQSEKKENAKSDKGDLTLACFLRCHQRRKAQEEKGMGGGTVVLISKDSL